MKAATLEHLREARAHKRPIVLLTDVESGCEALVPDEGEPRGGLAVGEELRAAARRALREDRSRLVEVDGARVFVHAFNPPLRMIVVGAVHIAQTLAPMAGLAGYAVTVVDPRRAFASEARFPGVEVVTEWPDDALEALAPDRRTAIVTLTHDPKLDDPALETALGSACFYIGALGSRRTHAARLDRLRAAGFDEAALGRIHAPVGLAIGATSPGEIAAAIVAEVVETLRRSPDA